MVALLHSLYGETVGAQAALRLRELIVRHFAASMAMSGGALSERDALPITYAEQGR